MMNRRALEKIKIMPLVTKAIQARGGIKAVTKAAWPLIILASGIVALAGVFMPWMSASAGGMTSTTSGWDLTRFNLVGLSIPQPFLVLAGGISMIVCGMLLVVGASLSVTYAIPYAKARKLFYTVGALIYISGALALGYGIYISVAAAVIGAIIGIRTSMQILKSLQITCAEDRGVCRDCT